MTLAALLVRAHKLAPVPAGLAEPAFAEADAQPLLPRSLLQTFGTFEGEDVLDSGGRGALLVTDELAEASKDGSSSRRVLVELDGVRRHMKRVRRRFGSGQVLAARLTAEYQPVPSRPGSTLRE